MNCPLYRIPIFLRKGGSLELGDLQALYEESLRVAAHRPDLSRLQRKEVW